MKIANGVEMLEISSNIMGMQSIIYPTLIWDKDTVILVDAGFPGQRAQIREAVEKAGVSFDNLSKVIITHQDMDHIGSLAGIAKELQGRVEVLAHVDEKPYITGEKTPIKIVQLEERIDSLTEEMKGFYEKLKAGFEKCKANVDKTVVDGEELPYCGKVTVIHTPGHTPGHICLYHKKSKTLITGDAMNIEDGRLMGADPRYAFDKDASIKSLEKLLQYDIENIICYHGGLYKDNANQSIAELIKSYSDLSK